MVNLFRCKVANCEIVSDAYDLTEEADLGCFSVSSKMIVDDDEYGETAGEKVIDVVKTFGYLKVTYTKKEYITYFKTYIKGIMGELAKECPDKVAEFKKHAMGFMKKFQSTPKADLEFWLNEATNPSGYVIWSFWKDPANDSAPTFMYFKYGLKEYKC